jgi:hypothetical protein
MGTPGTAELIWDYGRYKELTLDASQIDTKFHDEVQRDTNYGRMSALDAPLSDDLF